MSVCCEPPGPGSRISLRQFSSYWAIFHPHSILCSTHGWKNAFYLDVKNLRSFDLRLTLGLPLLRSLIRSFIRLCIQQFFYGKMLLVRRKLSLIGWTVSIDTHNGNKRDELRARIFKCLWSPGINSKDWIPPAFVGLAGRYDNPIPTRCLALIDCLKITALDSRPTCDGILEHCIGARNQEGIRLSCQPARPYFLESILGPLKV